MKTTLILLSTAALLFGASQAKADATITALPYTITTPGNYTVAANLTVSGASGITIASDDVVIDLAWHTITGASQSQFTGILCFTGVDSATPRRNILIRNGTIRGFRKGIYLAGTANSSKSGDLLPAEGFRVQNVTVFGSGERGIEFGICRSSVIEGCRISDIGGVSGVAGVSVPYAIFVQGGVIVRENYVAHMDINNNNNLNFGIYLSGGDFGASGFVLRNRVEGVTNGLLFERGIYQENIVLASSVPYRCDPENTTNAGGNF